MFNAPNDTLRNRLRPIYIARVKEVTVDDYNNQIITYDTPEFYGNRNYQPMDWKSMKEYREAFGSVGNNTFQCLLDYNELGLMKEWDLVYLLGVTPSGEAVNGANANYIVKSVRPQNTKLMVVFDEIKKER